MLPVSQRREICRQIMKIKWHEGNDGISMRSTSTVEKGMVGTVRAGFTEDMISSSALCHDSEMAKHGKGQRSFQTEEIACAKTGMS